MFKSVTDRWNISILVLLTCICILSAGERVNADTSLGTATITATILSAANLSIGATTVTFANANPASTPSIAATENSTSVTASARTLPSSTVTLTVLATSDLTSGGYTIPISNVTYTATGSGYVGGTLNKTTAQSLGSWTGGGVRSGTVSYFLANSFSYTPGTYTTMLTYTLIAP